MTAGRRSRDGPVTEPPRWLPLSPNCRRRRLISRPRAAWMGRSFQERTMLKKLGAAFGAALIVAAATTAQAAGSSSGAGAAFPAPVYHKWAEEYKAQTGISLNYQPIGSGGGIKQINAS